MITTVLNGGLGNQLFQIAAAYAIAKDNDDECGFDFNRPVINQGNPASTYRDNLYSLLNNLPQNWEPEYIYKEPKFNYIPIWDHKDMQLEGYFQSEKYFDKYKKELWSIFFNQQFIDNILTPLWYMYYYYLHRNVVSLHVRRGDYLKFADTHPLPNMEYYQDALRIIGDVDFILVFSDDINWCKENFIGGKYVFVEGLDDYEDLALMSLCSHNILANSSFSWWGSFFNRNPDKIIIAPQKWFGDEFNDDYSDIYTENMIVI